jgi:hypothetical protein
MSSPTILTPGEATTIETHVVISVIAVERRGGGITRDDVSGGNGREADTWNNFWI